jgi:2-polyprenyl-6-methoxyphenol hydroxylase-like FAD-dependent oxidoreductase
LPLDEPVTSFNVRRAEFDTLLLDRARELGADVRQGTRAARFEHNADGRVESVSWTDDRGGAGVIRAKFVVDACGLSSPLTRGTRVRDPALRHCAVLGYLRNARWKASYRAGERAAVFVLSVEKGWLWYIPLADDLISVGLVTDATEIRNQRKQGDLEALLLSELEQAPELCDVVRGATLCDDVLPDGARIRTCQEWSSFVETPFGPNWVAVGDAAMFVDPIVPSGVGFAMQSGHRAAYTWLTQQRQPEISHDDLWNAYAWYVRGEYGALSQLAHFLYANNGALVGRFWQRPLLNSWQLHIPEERTLSGCDFFPFPKAFGWRVVAPLLSGIAGQPGALEGVYRNEGLPADFRGLHYEVRAPLSLALRTEYPIDGTRTGQLRLYRDVVTSSRDYYHRLALRPADLPARLEPIVRALSDHRQVDSLLAAAPGLLWATAHERPAIDRAVRQLLRIVARRGFIRMRQTPTA